jgi:predicted NBD/HSP70 family sugar kinase
MASFPNDEPAQGPHGAHRLLSVRIDGYNADLKDDGGFIGDRASGRAFKAILEDERERVNNGSSDPFGGVPTDNLDKNDLDETIIEGDSEAAGLLLGAIEEFAQEFSTVIHRFARLEDWRDTQRIVIGGGLTSSRIGHMAVGRTAALVKSSGLPIELRAIRYHGHEAGLIGAIHLATPDTLEGQTGMLTIDIGGSNARVGVVVLNADKGGDLSEAKLCHCDVWEHRDAQPSRDEAVEQIACMIRKAMARAGDDGLTLAPVIGVGCPGLIRADGTIEKGGQNLPGNWEEPGFNLPEQLRSAFRSSDHPDLQIVMHNDAVVQGLSEAPFMRDIKR